MPQIAIKCDKGFSRNYIQETIAFFLFQFYWCVIVLWTLSIIYVFPLQNTQITDIKWHTVIYQNGPQKKVLVTIHKIWNPQPCERIDNKGRKREDSYHSSHTRQSLIWGTNAGFWNTFTTKWTPVNNLGMWTIITSMNHGHLLIAITEKSKHLKCFINYTAVQRAFYSKEPLLTEGVIRFDAHFLRQTLISRWVASIWKGSAAKASKYWLLWSLCNFLKVTLMSRYGPGKRLHQELCHSENWMPKF